MNVRHTISSSANKGKPFLRWAGGKRWLIKHLESFLPETFNQYHEPFIGGGSIFLYLNPKKAFISDFNAELIEAYDSVKNNPQEIIKHIKSFKNTKEEYLTIRTQNFQSAEKRAARFIYLNQTSFNGIYRVNSQGKYNVPYGHRTKYQFDFENILEVSKVLKNINIFHADFMQCIENVKENDLIFLDPPYTVTHNNNGFIQYNQKIFSLEDQHRLADLIQQIKDKKAYYILTNANHLKIREIFDFGDEITEISRASLIGGKGAVRGKYSEIIMTNIRREVNGIFN
ncbi:MAG: Dam family site-specific DNA-(adenine-N6)-methyltransferase [Sulfurovum sp.]|nr:Dam family site-specific DNA-(adenine-N6)-methyltransferase [Sulfurovum sp.]